jgi:hypothetical protein
VVNTFDAFVWEPALVKLNAIQVRAHTHMHASVRPANHGQHNLRQPHNNSVKFQGSVLICRGAFHLLLLLLTECH